MIADAKIRIEVLDAPDEQQIHALAVFAYHGSEGMMGWIRRQCARRESEPSYHVVAWDPDAPTKVIASVYCQRHREDKTAWFYGDLSVDTHWRRRFVASRLLACAMQRMRQEGGETLCCYVMENNEASIALQRALGFVEIPVSSFDGMTIPKRAKMFWRKLEGVFPDKYEEQFSTNGREIRG